MTTRLGLLGVFVVVAHAQIARAQSVTPTARVVAELEGGQTAATAQALTWHAYPDRAPMPVTVTPVLCVDSTPSSATTCTMPMPPFAPGTHTVALSVNDGVLESSQSPELSFVVAAQAPGTSGTLLWNPNPAAEMVTSYTVTLNGTFVGTTAGTSQAILFTTTGTQTLTVTATNAAGPGPTATLVYTLVPPLPRPTMPTGVRVTVP